MLPSERTWLAKPPLRPKHTPVVLYLGCNVLRTGHLVKTVHTSSR